MCEQDVTHSNVSCFVLCFRYGGWDFGKPLPIDLKLDMLDVPDNRTLSKVIWMSDITVHCPNGKVAHCPNVAVYVDANRICSKTK